MSYCRWSSDNWTCDVYCYEHCDGGWTTHVAEDRIVGEVPKVPSILTTQQDEWIIAHKAAHCYLDKAEYKPIGLPHDGKTFNDPTIEDFRVRLIELRDLGYHVPDYVFETIDEEIAKGPAS